MQAVTNMAFPRSSSVRSSLVTLGLAMVGRSCAAPRHAFAQPPAPGAWAGVSTSTAPFQTPALSLRRLRGGVASGVNMQIQDGYGTRAAKVGNPHDLALASPQKQTTLLTLGDASEDSCRVKLIG